MGRRIAVIPGDGIGPEVITEALKVVRAAGVALETTDYDLGGARYLRTGEVLPDAVLDDKIDRFLLLLGIYDDRYQTLSSYSKGMRQKILVAAAVLMPVANWLSS